MKVGDLVTLSQYALGLSTIPPKYRRWWAPDAPSLYGIITEIREREDKMLSENEKREFVVKWNVDDLTGRYYYARYFYRKDLKYFR
tara:strand:- start:142 stop:399 length:258 start_codon:yes stop_codon:yes gene_type:complete